VKTKAAVLFEQPGAWVVSEVDLDPPQEYEVLVEFAACGLCHSDDHLAKGDMQLGHLPYCGGHEGAGVVLEVGPGVRGLAVGDHIVTSFIPGCGKCRWCAGGQQNLCDNGALLMTGSQMDGSFRMHIGDTDVGQGSLLSCFAQHSVLPEWSCIKIAPDIPLLTAALVGCAVPTGWGSAVNAAQVSPGDVVIVSGVGGVGINAVQGAAHAGAAHVVAVDPAPLKRATALKLGGTAAFATIEEARDHVRELTNGQGADAAIVTIGVVTSADVADAFTSIRKGGTVVVTGMGKKTEIGIPVGLFELTMYQKRVQGCLYGMMSPSKDVPRLLGLYQTGHLKLDEIVTRTYPLEQINDGYVDMHAGDVVRGVIDYSLGG
jgi:S-(hydroxymethyl)glutathione dehydrogenase/alcohol dehydrogenase